MQIFKAGFLIIPFSIFLIQIRIQDSVPRTKGDSKWIFYIDNFRRLLFSYFFPGWSFGSRTSMERLKPKVRSKKEGVRGTEPQIRFFDQKPDPKPWLKVRTVQFVCLVFLLTFRLWSFHTGTVFLFRIPRST